MDEISNHPTRTNSGAAMQLKQLKANLDAHLTSVDYTERSEHGIDHDVMRALHEQATALDQATGLLIEAQDALDPDDKLYVEIQGFLASRGATDTAYLRELLDQMNDFVKTAPLEVNVEGWIRAGTGTYSVNINELDEQDYEVLSGHVRNDFAAEEAEVTHYFTPIKGNAQFQHRVFWKITHPPGEGETISESGFGESHPNMLIAYCLAWLDMARSLEL